MIKNEMKGRNDFYKVNSKDILSKLSKVNIEDKPYGFKYSNFGFAVLGVILENVYKKDYTSLANTFINNEMKFSDTYVFEDGRSIYKEWTWEKNDAYIAAGAIKSNIVDMLSYANSVMNKEICDGDNLNVLRKVKVNNNQSQIFDININELMYSWIKDTKNNIVWHNGGTGHYNSYIGLKPEKKEAVVILSNLAPNYRIPVTVVGIKLFKENNE